MQHTRKRGGYVHRDTQQQQGSNPRSVAAALATDGRGLARRRAGLQAVQVPAAAAAPARRRKGGGERGRRVQAAERAGRAAGRRQRGMSSLWGPGTAAGHQRKKVRAVLAQRRVGGSGSHAVASPTAAPGIISSHRKRGAGRARSTRVSGLVEGQPWAGCEGGARGGDDGALGCGRGGGAHGGACRLCVHGARAASCTPACFVVHVAWPGAGGQHAATLQAEGGKRVHALNPKVGSAARSPGALQLRQGA